MENKFNGQRIHCRSETDPFIYEKLDYDKSGGNLNLCKYYINYIYNPPGKIIKVRLYLTIYIKVKFQKQRLEYNKEYAYNLTQEKLRQNIIKHILNTYLMCIKGFI